MPPKKTAKKPAKVVKKSIPATKPSLTGYLEISNTDKNLSFIKDNLKSESASIIPVIKNSKISFKVVSDIHHETVIMQDLGYVCYLLKYYGIPFKRSIFSLYKKNLAGGILIDKSSIYFRGYKDWKDIEYLVEI